ncbi:disulfide bond formation protein B [Roseovarius sp. D22-M7]|uniref:disulfide bond formation protein B n=1 Tax=Roseovarius sp. D22-M7 TaxID=3127116 RepID=UPI00300F9025
MGLSRRQLAGLAAGGSAALLLAAFGFQHIGGMAPCSLCVWQRWPHVVGVACGAVALFALPRAVALAGMMAALATAAIGGYHTGVERGWWKGPGTCTSSGTSGLSADELFDRIMAAPLVRCDEVPWQLLGLSMASWNMVLALGLAGIWFLALRAR